MKKLAMMVREVVLDYFHPLTYLFGSKPCDCYMVDEEDHFGGKVFKHYRNGNLYRFLFSATTKGLVKEQLVVVYQDIESTRRYARSWNDFFSTTKLDGKRVPRFEEQE
jgi:hypothetical protein